MYTSFYNLKAKPFQISSDPAFIWLGEKHKEALATLTYGVLDNKGFMLLTGDVGTGKTTLINTLIKGLSDDILYASVPDPRLGLNDFLNYVASAFNIKRSFKTKGKFLIYFSEFLQRAYENKKKVLLLIDESQLLTQNMLEEIRLLSNIQKDGNNLLNIFFVGQDEFNEILDRQENRAVAQRLTLNYHLAPLSEQETAQYIKHRLLVAGTSEQLFDAEAVHEIQIFSGGFPRRINIICDHCLLTGFVKEQKMIDAEIVRTCAHDLKIPQYLPRRATTTRSIPFQPDSGPLPVTAVAAYPPSDVPVTISVASEGSAPVPNRPLPQRRPMVLRRLFTAVCLLACCGLLLFVFDPTTFNSLYDEARQYLISMQDKLNTPPPLRKTGAEVSMPQAPVKTTGSGVEQSGEAPAQKDQKSPEPKKPLKVEKPSETLSSGETVITQPLSAQTDNSEHLPKPDILQSIGVATSGSSGQVTSEEEGAAQVVATESGDGNLRIPANSPPQPEPEPVARSTQPEKQENASPDIPLPRETIIVRFDNDSSEFYFTDFDQVDALASAIKKHPDVVMVISGYTDSLGSEGYNYRLSLFRANMIKSFFLGKGVPSYQLKVRAFGSKIPIMTNDTEEGRRMNRRVEIDIVQ